jgi:glycosyltransferase involved in cell wall biosynthesis
MRILALNWRDITHPWAGGAEVYIHELAKRWAAWGHEVTLLCSQYPPGFPGCTAEETVDGLKILRRGGRFTVYARAFFEYALRLRRECDVILDIENGIPFFTPFYARKPTGIMVHHVHKEQFFVEAGFPLNWTAYLFETRLMPMAYRHCSFITGSNSTKAELIALGIPDQHIRMIHYGLDHTLYFPSVHKAPTPTILYLGRLKRYKRLDLLLRTMPQILQACPNASLWIAGQGDAQGPLEHLVARLGLSGHVTLLGFVDEREKVRLLQQAWVFVSPSMTEGWGLSVLEANACGTPAVVFNVPGLRDAVLDGQTGLVLPDGDLSGLSRGIALILQDASLREQLRRDAIAWSQRFDWDESAKSVLRVLEEVHATTRWTRNPC